MLLCFVAFETQTFSPLAPENLGGYFPYYICHTLIGNGLLIVCLFGGG